MTRRSNPCAFNSPPGAGTGAGAASVGRRVLFIPGGALAAAGKIGSGLRIGLRILPAVQRPGGGAPICPQLIPGGAGSRRSLPRWALAGASALAGAPALFREVES